MIARLSLQNERIQAVALGSTRGPEPVYELQRAVGALVLAEDMPAGAAADLAVLMEKLRRARIDHIGVVTGRSSAAVRGALQHFDAKIGQNHAYRAGGIVAFVSNGGFIDASSFDGFRQAVAVEFDTIYCYNLRGDQRTAGDMSRREGGKIERIVLGYRPAMNASRQQQQRAAMRHAGKPEAAVPIGVNRRPVRKVRRAHHDAFAA